VHLLRSVANLLAALVQRRRTEEQLAHSQRLDALGQLTGGIAHDFNNLLTIMSGSLQLLEIEFEARPEAQELIASALRSATRGAELTAKLLAFARRQRLSPCAIDPRTLLHDLELMLKGALGDAIHLKLECTGEVPAAYADPTQLDTALVNLALNARDAMPQGGEIKLRASERWVSVDHASPELGAGHYVVFCVCDTGRGMAPETLARAAEPFFTTKALGHGTGLGLSMAYGFVKQSGGHMRIESRLGYGTSVELYLPVAPASSPTAVPALPGLATSHGETVLVVEDDPEVRSIAAASLRHLGYRVIAVGNAREALQQLEENASIALLFSDVMLGPGMSGAELAEAARNGRPDLAVLLTSGYDNPMTDGSAGMTFEMLRKPYRREQLGIAIRRLIGRTA
jgi:nitrogen-specific signal transduction histidine kinase